MVFLAAALVLLSVPTPGDSRVCPCPRDGEMVGWWPLDEGSGTVASDASGLGNDGVLQGGVVFSTDSVQGPSALDFTDPRGQVVVPHSASLEPATGTIEAWVKVASLHDADVVEKVTTCQVRSQNCGVGQSVYGLRINALGGAVGFVMNDDPTTPGAPWRFAISPPGLLTVRTWHHLAMRWDGSHVAIFVDGVKRDEQPYDPVPGAGLSYDGATSFGLGVATNGGGELIGRLDDVRFHGCPRTDAQILADSRLRGDEPGILSGGSCGDSFPQCGGACPLFQQCRTVRICGSGFGECETDADCAPFSCLPTDCRCEGPLVPLPGLIR